MSNLHIPRNLFLEITSECNLKCKLCKSWKNKDPQDKLTIQKKLNFLEDFVNWIQKTNHNAINNLSIILTGGEPFLYPFQVFSIADFSKKVNLRCYVNTNGLLLGSAIDKIINSGLTAITISIDSHHAKKHDKLRGCSGLFNKLIKHINKLLERRKKCEKSLKIYTQSVLGNWNINELNEQIHFFENLGIDGIIFQPIQQTFGLNKSLNERIKNWEDFPNSESMVRDALKLLINYKNKSNFLINSKKEIELWQFYFENPVQFPKELNPCGAYKQNLIIDVLGYFHFCFGQNIKIGNISKIKIDEFYAGAKAIKIREFMKNCNLGCGVMACHINNKLLF